MTNQINQDHLYGKILLQSVRLKHSFLREYCQYSETLFEKEVEHDRELFERHNTAEHDVNSPGYDRKPSKEFFSQADEFRKTLRRSNFITAFSFWESQYRNYAEWILISHNRRSGSMTGIGLTDIKGESVSDRYRTILVQHIGVTDDQALWTVLDDLSVVRHQIVHGVGELSTAEIEKAAAERYEHLVPVHDRLIEVLNKYEEKGLSMDKNGDILVDASLIEYLIDTTEAYMNDVLTKQVEHLKESTAVS